MQSLGLTTVRCGPLPPRERQQLFRQRRATVGTGFRRFQVAIGGAGPFGLLLDVAGAGQNGREHVVEIVGNPGGEGADGLDLLHLHEVAVQLLGLDGAGHDVGDGLHLGHQRRRNTRGLR